MKLLKTSRPVFTDGRGQKPQSRLTVSQRRDCVRCDSGRIVRHRSPRLSYDCMECDTTFKGIKLVWFRVAW